MEVLWMKFRIQFRFYRRKVMSAIGKGHQAAPFTETFLNGKPHEFVIIAVCL